MSIVSIANVVRHFPGPDGQPVAAVSDLSLDIEPGEVFGLLGPNGAGKSTTLRMLCGLIPMTSGSITVSGVDVANNPQGARAKLGYLSASSGLPHRLTCREVLTLFAKLQQAGPGAVEGAIERYGISEFADKRVESLSTGMKQRVRIATAAVHRPGLLILDEPTAGLDLVAADALLDDIALLKQTGCTVIFSTHILREAAKVCDRIGILFESRLLALGTPTELLAQTGTATLEDAFLQLVKRSRK